MNRMMKIAGAGLVLSAAVHAALAAQNCISNGDFELPAANYRNGTQYAYNKLIG